MGFNITVKHSAYQFEAEEYESVLEAAVRQGVPIPYSCQSGSCGSCKGVVEKGHIDYNGQTIMAIDPDNDNNEVLFCSAYAHSDLEISIPGLSDEPMAGPSEFTASVTTRQSLSPYIEKVVLKPQGSFRYKAGQYIEIKVGNKSYPLSIANAPGGDIEVHIQHLGPDSPANALLDALQLQAQVQIYGPLGEAYLKEGLETPVLLVAGGSGFAPIKAILEQLLAQGAKRDIYLYWGVRQPEHFYFQEKLALWTKLIPRLHYVPVISEPCDSWSGRKGLVHQVVLEDFKDLSGLEAYLAGPFAMSYTARDELLARGMSPNNIHADAFAFIKKP